MDTVFLLFTYFSLNHLGYRGLIRVFDVFMIGLKSLPRRKHAIAWIVYLPQKRGLLIAKYCFSGENENKFNRYMKRKKKELIPQPKMIERFSPGVVFF